ncbi:MAG: hypothetical protein LBQ84_02275 [Flavobacteriaceae bacterium]|jgi:hypothetical protein|nr:hypothetical protein [Flavobacteriaceae bacterium]
MKKEFNIMKNKAIICGIALLAVFQTGKAQTTGFYPNDVIDVFNSYGNNFDGVGTARYLGMGESMGALGGDLSAVETNPAGLGIFKNSEASVSLSVLSSGNKASMTDSYKRTDTNFNLPGAGFVLALGDDSEPLKFNIGASYSYQSLDNEVYFPQNQNIRYLYPDVNGVDQEYIFEGYEQYTSGYKSKTKFSIAANYQDKVYFGLGLDWHYLNIDRNVHYTHRNTVDGELLVFNEQFTPYSQSANGFGLSLGVLGKITPEIRLGLAYHSPVWWSDIGYDYIAYNTDKTGDIYRDRWYYDNYKNTAPGKIVVSGAYASNIINDNNSLAFNIDFINYFNKGIEFKGDTDYKINNNFVSDYVQNSQEYRAGVEYRYKWLKLRTGYAHVSSPVKDKSIQGTFDLSSNGTYVKNYLAGEVNKFSVGVGYDLGPFFVDFAYQNSKTDYYTSLSGQFYNSGSDASIELDNNIPLLGKVTNTQDNFVLTLGMRF